MLINLIDQKIRKAFSDAALQYDALTGLHKEIGRELTAKLRCCTPCARVLDIGMGTGWFTRRLTQFFPEAVIAGIDPAEGMIARAREKECVFQIVQADAAHLPFKMGRFDIITSNLAYQWIKDLKKSFSQCHGLLTQDGTLAMTMFGHDTFKELFEALEQCSQRQSNGRDFQAVRLADERQVAHALTEAGFQSVATDVERIKVRFPDMISLVKWVRDIGANALSSDLYIGKELLFRANEYYNRVFRDRLGVYATFEVIWVHAKH